jgi:hypothetical protein
MKIYSQKKFNIPFFEAFFLHRSQMTFELSCVNDRKVQATQTISCLSKRRRSKLILKPFELPRLQTQIEQK